MKHKKLVALCLALLLVTLVGCQSKPTAKAYTPGTYEGEAPGHNGPIKVSVTFDENAIKEIKVVAHEETEGVGTPVFDRLAEEIVEQQSLGVDALTGATLTSHSFINAVAACVEKAGGNVEELKAKTVEKKPGEKIEKTADVVIVGGGGAGMAAGISAVQSGASVIIIEKNATIGGNTLVSGCAWNAANPELATQTPAAVGLENKLKSFLEMKESDLPPEFGPTLKKLKEQIQTYLAGDTSKMFDSPELHMIQTYFAGKRQALDGTTIEGKFEFIEVLCQKSLETQKWLSETVGTEFTNELSEPIGSLWKRSNTPKSKWVDFFVKPADYITQNGGEIICEVTGQELIEENGKVVGVKAVMKDGTPMELRANKGVVLATGGFAANKEMVMEYNNYWPEIDPNILTTNRTGARGEGIQMAQKVDADLTGMGFTQLMPIGWAHTGLLAYGGGSNVMYITPEGKRFVNEYAERDVISKAAIDNGWIFYELKTLGSDPFPPADNATESSVVFIADTLDEMAEKIGCDAATLKAEVEKYNSYVEKGSDPDFGKTSFTHKIEAPYVARKMKPSLHHTMGGLLIDTDCHVIDKSGKKIDGLYAAGEVTGGIHAGNRVGGNAIADIFVFGRIAGANAAAGK
ncbi:MAG: FAD-binding protein [Firmicutes bacterium]|nr:FAD-binding protein [Bacillota bacterium]